MRKGSLGYVRIGFVWIGEVGKCFRLGYVRFEGKEGWAR
jgi:hypothetical protein